ncbi:MAG TPA: glycosyltransferase family 4 protein [Bryobacteraceae bacterium]|jgi:glycosyltransferase involved in cell wall biosynthesis|nr:glycosyltransferase family 4 protein [Bryobacteraceae bacterium]
MIRSAGGEAKQATRRGKASERRLRVFMMDLMAIVPYYTGHLCAALECENGIDLWLGSITYYLDRGFFRRLHLRNRPGLMDVVSRIPFATAPRRILKLAEYLANLAALVGRFVIRPPDVLHVQFLPLAGRGLPVEEWFLRLLRRRGAAIIYTVHNVLPHENGEGLRSTYQRLYALPDRFICHDSCARDRLAAEFDVPAARISVIPHGALFDEWRDPSVAESRRRLGLPEDRCVVLMQGILRPYKGYAFLLEAWRRVARQAGALLVIAGTGDPDVLRSITHQVRDLDLAASVRLELKFAPLDVVDAYYRAADILVYPYSAVTTSGALMTGIAHGKPIVATKLPAFERIIRDGDNGLMAEFGRVDELSAQLVKLIEDPALRADLGRAARETYKKVPQWPAIARATLESYRCAVREKHERFLH